MNFENESININNEKREKKVNNHKITTLHRKFLLVFKPFLAVTYSNSEKPVKEVN